MLAWAMTWAIPLPIVPAPMTRTRSMTVNSAFAVVSLVFRTPHSPAGADRSALVRLYVPCSERIGRIADLAFLDGRRRAVVRFGCAVAAIHGDDDAVTCPILRTIGRCLEHGGKHSLFLGCEAGEDLTGGMSGSAADPDSHSGECFTAELSDDRFESIVAA